jgi:hypothetical protein
MEKFVLLKGLKRDDAPLRDRRGDPSGILLMCVLTIADTKDAVDAVVQTLGQAYRFAGGERIGSYGIISSQTRGECARVRPARLDESIRRPPQPVRIEAFERFKTNKETPRTASKQLKRLGMVLRLDVIIAMATEVIDLQDRRLEQELLRRKSSPFLTFCEICADPIERRIYLRHGDPWRLRCAKH